MPQPVERTRFCSGRCTIATDLDDLFSVGYCSLTKALDNYKLHSGVPFSSFARHYVLGAIREHIRSYRRTVHVPKNSDSDRKSLERCTNEFIAQHDGRSPTDAELAVDLGWEAAQVSSVKSSLEALSSPLQISESTDEVYSGQMSPEDDRAPDAYAESKLLLQRAASILQRMRTRESNVIILRHGLDGEIALSNREVATILNTTPAEIENIYNNGIRRFRKLNAQLQHNPRDERAAVEAVQGMTKLLADNLRRVAGIRRKRYMAIALTVLDSSSRTCSLKDFMTAVAGAISRAKLKAFSRDRFDNDSSEAAYFGIQHLLQAGCIATSADGEYISMTEKGDAWLGAYRHRIF